MSFLRSKKFLLLIGFWIGIGTLATTVGLGIHFANLNNTNQTVASNENNQIDNKTDKETNNLAAIELLKNSLNLVDEKAIVLVNKNKKDDTYAFSILNNQLDLNKTIKPEEGVSLKVELNEELNNATSLNDGILNVLVKATNKDGLVETKNVVLSGFKQGDSVLRHFFINKNQSTLDLSVVDKRINKSDIFVEKQERFFSTIEDLNTVISLPQKKGEKYEQLSGLDLLLKDHSNFSNQYDTNNWRIEGKVKLDRIEKIKNQTYFYLSSIDKSQYLKLINYSNDAINKEVAIQQIRTTNLLATDISLIPNEIDENQTQTLINSLKTKGYITSESNLSLNRNLAINLGKANDNNNLKNIVFTNPYVISKQTNNSNLGFHLKISFGKNEYLKQYDTTNQADLKELKDGGFNFDIYTKKINESSKELNVSVLENKKEQLTSYFFEHKYKFPTQKEPISGDGPDKNGFNLTKVELNESNISNLPIKLNGNEENWLVFANYSYKGLEENEVFFTPNLTLVHLNKTR